MTLHPQMSNITSSKTQTACMQLHYNIMLGGCSGGNNQSDLQCWSHLVKHPVSIKTHHLYETSDQFSLTNYDDYAPL